LTSRTTPRERELWSEVRTLRAQVAALQKERLLLDPLRAGVGIGPLEAYVRALADLATEAWAVRGSNPEAIPPKGGSSDGPMPSPVPAWAQDVFRREMRDLGRRTERLAEWMERPRNIKGRSRRQCWECGRGLARGHLFCPACGTKAKEEKAEGE
jgi:hypothetical protein